MRISDWSSDVCSSDLVATLPVVALGVGVGVDYGIYLFERIQHHLAEGHSFEESFREAMLERGTAAVFTAITMAIGVGTWTFSALKYQGDKIGRASCRERVCQYV